MTIVVLNRSADAKRFYNWVTNDILLIEERCVTNIKLILTSRLRISRLLDSITN
jgi:hypothetical protein